MPAPGILQVAGTIIGKSIFEEGRDAEEESGRGKHAQYCFVVR